MKTTLNLFILALAISLASCSKSTDDNPSNSSGSKTEQVSGNWTVTYYFDSGKDETHDFSGYSFDFATSGVLTATSGSASYSGSWSIGDKSSDDDSSSNKLVINITGNKAMEDLEDDWLIVKLTENELHLKDDNPESAEELKFGR